MSLILLNNFSRTNSKSSLSATTSDKDTVQENKTGQTALTSTDANCIMDGFEGKDIAGTFDMSKMTPEMIAAAETMGSVASAETAGSIASAETAGSIACAETAGSIADAGGDCSASFDGGGFDGGCGGGFSSFG